MANGRPLIISGDFNAEPNEPVYSTVINCDTLRLSSAYAELLGSTASDKETAQFDEVAVIEDKSRVEYLMSHEPPFTTWKIREEGEVCHTIDYVFYSHDKFKVRGRHVAIAEV